VTREAHLGSGRPPEGREKENWVEAEARLRALFGHIRLVRESNGVVKRAGKS
jgi:hypothetical protein